MSEEENIPAAGAEDAQPGFAIKGQYVKDLSFENPLAPQSLVVTGGKPGIEINVDIKVQKLQKDIYEMALHLATRATSDGNTMFLVDLSYAGIFHLANIPDDRIEMVLLIDCAFVLFPFARRVIADVTRDGGFPPLMLDPIDFHALYMQSRGEQESAA